MPTNIIPHELIDPSQGGYLALYLNSILSSGGPQALLGLLLVTLARFLPIIALSPFLGAKLLPHPVKMVLAISLFAIFLPTMAQVLTTDLPFTPILIIYAAKEMVVGMLIGYLMSIPFTLMQSVGFIIDHQRGSASLMVSDPAIQNQASPLGLLFNFVLIYIFYQLDGPFLFFEVVKDSFELVPPDRFISPLFFTDDNVFWQKMMNMTNRFMVLSVQLAAPSMIIILMTDFFLGITNRLAPQVQIIFLGLGLKSMVPFIVLTLGWYIFVEQIAKESIDWVYQTKEMVVIMGKSTKDIMPSPAEEQPLYIPKKR